MARLWASAALLPLALLAQILVFYPAAVTAQDPDDAVPIYTIDGVAPEYVYDTSNISVPVVSTDFNFTAIEVLSQLFSATQGQVQTNNVEPNTIVLRLPKPSATVINPEALLLELVGRFNYLGPADPDDPTNPVLGMYGDVEGMAPAPGSPAADLNFYLFIDPNAQTVEGGVVIGDTYFHFETVDGAIVITAFPFEVGLCRLEQAGAAPEPGKMTKAERRAYRQGIKDQKKLARAAKKADARARRAEKLVQKHAGVGLSKTKQRELETAEHGGDAHAHEHEHGHDHRHDHEAMKRQLQTTAGRLLVFIDFAPPDSVYRPWNGGNFIDIVQCSLTSVTAAVQARTVSAVLEDFAPFNVEVTTNRSFYNSQIGRKVAVNVVQSAIGVMGRGNSCGVAYLNSLSWVSNTVWASCLCGLNGIAQIISHEVGHIFNLRHDGSTNPASAYLFGLPAPGVLPSNRRWNAIMGGVTTVGIDQWSRGEYVNADNTQDDIGIITTAVGARQSAHAACTTTFAYRDLSTVLSTTFTAFPESIITCAGGVHSYPVRIRALYALTVTPPAEGNMKVRISFARAVLQNGQWIASTAFTTLGTNDAYASTAFAYTAPGAVTAGNYIVRIQSIAEPGNANTYPFPVYGSVGRYTLRIRNGF